MIYRSPARGKRSRPAAAAGFATVLLVPRPAGS